MIRSEAEKIALHAARFATYKSEEASLVSRLAYVRLEAREEARSILSLDGTTVEEFESTYGPIPESPTTTPMVDDDA